MRWGMRQVPDFAFEFYAQPGYLVLVRSFVGCICDTLNFSPEEALRLEICVDEACANSIAGIREVEGDFPETKVRIEFFILPEGIGLSVWDKGKDFSDQFMEALPLSDFSDRSRKRGYGLQIIKTLMDEVCYNRDPETGNCLTFYKFFRMK